MNREPCSYWYVIRCWHGPIIGRDRWEVGRFWNQHKKTCMYQKPIRRAFRETVGTVSEYNKRVGLMLDAAREFDRTSE